MAKIELKNVTKSYGAVQVIKGIDLDIRKGEFMVFVGPSGCGKSTLLRLVAGLEEISTGDMLFDNQRVNDLVPSDRGIAMVFQSYALYPHMKVYDNMAFGLKLAKSDKGEIDRRVREAARMLQIEHLLDRLPKQLSGGQRQRVAIGRAIVRDPRVFLFDEPLSNLDAALRVQTRLEIAKLHHDMESATMIYVTHDQVEAMTLADRIVVLRGGRIEQAGTPQEVFGQPVSRFIAEFLGYENFFTLADGRLATVRPERLLVEAPDAVGEGLLMPGTVVDVAFRGVDLLVTSEVTDPSGRPARLTADLRGVATGSIAPGDSVNVHVAPEHLISIAA